LQFGLVLGTGLVSHTVDSGVRVRVTVRVRVRVRVGVTVRVRVGVSLRVRVSLEACGVRQNEQ